MNHSKDFWKLVESYMPDYKIAKQELRKQKGNVMISLEENTRKIKKLEERLLEIGGSL